MHNATVAERVEINSKLLRLRVVPDSGVPRFVPGQYVTLGLLVEQDNPKSLVQQVYSIASPPEEVDALEFFIVVVPDGMLTPRLEQLGEGDRLFMSPRAKGKFTLAGISPRADLYFISTGTGIAPFMSMLRSSSAWSGTRKISLVHGVRYPEDLAYRSELEDLREQYSEFSYYPIVSRDSDNWTGDRGHVQHYLDQGILTPNPDRDYVFLSGNPIMVADLARQCCEIGFVPRRRQKFGNLYLEQHWEV